MKTQKAVAFLNSLLLIIPFIFLISCSEDNVINPDNGVPFEIKVWDYSEDHFFLDTIYKASFADYYENENFTQQTENLKVDENSFEVWVQTDVTVTSYRKAGLHIDLPVMPSGGYDDSLKKVPNPRQGISTFGNVRKLEQSDYKLNKYAGYVSLKIDLPDNYFAGITYKRTNTGEQFGTISTDTNITSQDTLILKMIRVANLIPQDSLAWDLQLRNIYKLPKKNITESPFGFQIMYLYNDKYETVLPVTNLNSYLLTITGLDKYTYYRLGGPDTMFDYLPGYTIDTENGWVIFPDLKPFLETLESYSNKGVTIPADFWYPEIYDNLKSVSKTFPNANKYIIAGQIKE